MKQRTFASIRHRRKLWKLVSQGIEVKSVAGVTKYALSLAIEANYVEMSENYSFPDIVETLLWAQCEPNQCGADQRLPLSQATRSGDDRALEKLLQAKTLYLQRKNKRHP